MTIRLYVHVVLARGAELDLPPGAARHAQVRRVQPGDRLVLFNGQGSDWPAEVLAMGRQAVRVRLEEPLPAAPELPMAITLALAMPANERMDALVEKATELGVASIQPLLTERSVLRLAGERAERKQAHWQAIAQAACEQCGRAYVPVIEPVRSLTAYLPHPAPGLRLLLSLDPAAQLLSALTSASAWQAAVSTLSGPEGGLTPDEESLARAAGFVPASLGGRVLRADTAPLAALAWLAMQPAKPPP
jgi:16S rRNA (uracil1498-N3)-methyltransferase